MLGSSNNNSGTLLVLKPKSQNKDKESVKPYFEVSKKGANGWEVTDDQSISIVEGNLFKAEAKEDEYKGDKYFKANIFLRDNEESYLITFRLNISTRSLLNALFSLESYDDVAISYYRSKSGFDTFSVTQNGERVSWKFELSDLPKPDEVTFKGKTIKDFSKVDEFFVEQLKDLSAKVAKATNSVDKKAVAETETTVSADSDSDVEF